MRRRMMKSKIHRATVTDADLNYVGSISIDATLMQRADIIENEQVTVLDIDNGARFETYAIVGQPGEICLNGAAARLVQPGDTVILLTFADYDDAELVDFSPRVVHVDAANQQITAEAAQAGAAQGEAATATPSALANERPGSAQRPRPAGRGVGYSRRE